MRVRPLLLVLPLAVFAQMAYGQQPAASSQAPAVGGLANVKSPEVAADRHVTFRLVAPKASAVSVVCECLTLEEIGKLTRARSVLLHVDAVQGVGRTPFDVEKMNVDLASITAHKIYGPKGIGALYVRRARPRVRLASQMDGGGHERGNRSGTLNVPGIVGFAKACELAQKIAGNAPLSNFAVMQALPRIADLSQSDGLFVESLMAAIAQGDDAAKQRVRAFLEKRAGKVERQ